MAKDDQMRTRWSLRRPLRWTPREALRWSLLLAVHAAALLLLLWTLTQFRGFP